MTVFHFFFKSLYRVVLSVYLAVFIPHTFIPHTLLEAQTKHHIDIFKSTVNPVSCLFFFFFLMSTYYVPGDFLVFGFSTKNKQRNKQIETNKYTIVISIIYGDC